jgi:hypothetical protein
MMIVSNALGVTDWAAGTHDVRFKVNGASADITLNEIHVCRVNAACANQESLGSATSLADLCDTAPQVKQHDVTCSATTALDTDKLAYIFTFTCAHEHADKGIAVLNDQPIVTPIEEAEGGVLIIPVAMNTYRQQRTA